MKEEIEGNLISLEYFKNLYRFYSLCEDYNLKPEIKVFYDDGKKYIIMHGRGIDKSLLDPEDFSIPRVIGENKED